MNPAHAHPRQSIILVCGLLVAAAMLAVPPWRDLHVPPFGSGESFGGYSPWFWPPHDPWTLPFLAANPFWNAQHEYRINWPVLAVQVAAIAVITVVACVVSGRKSINEPADAGAWSVAGAWLGGIAALVCGFLGVMAIMAPLLDLAPQAQVITTSLLLAGYLIAIVAGTWIGASLGIKSTAMVVAGSMAGQLVTAYTAFVIVQDASPQSHRLLFAVWLAATTAGTAAGALAARLSPR